MARILVVDDDPSIRTACRAMLAHAGHEVACAEDGNQALRAFEAETFDLILMDIIMPDKEGLETIRQLRRSGARIPIIAMSGGGRAAGSSYLEVAMALGATRSLQKPFGVQRLVDAVAECLSLAKVATAA